MSAGEREPLCKACTHPLSWRDDRGICTHCGCTNHSKARGRRRGQFVVPPATSADAEALRSSKVADAVDDVRKALHGLVRAASALLDVLPMPQRVPYVIRSEDPPMTVECSTPQQARELGSFFPTGPRSAPRSIHPRSRRQLGSVFDGAPAPILDLSDRRKRKAASSDDAAPMRILRVLAAARKPLTRRQIAILANVRTTVSTYRNSIGELEAQGYITGGTDSKQATHHGIVAAGDVAPLPTGPELVDYWRRELGDGMPRLMLDVLVRCAREGRELSRQELAAAVDTEPGVSTFRNAIGRLRTLDLVEKKTTRLAPELVKGARP